MKSITALLMAIALACPVCAIGTSALAGSKFTPPLGANKKTKKKKKKKKTTKKQESHSQPTTYSDEDIVITMFDVATQ